jgi:hypothetical protein
VPLRELEAFLAPDPLDLLVIDGPALDLTAFLYQRDGDYCIGMISSRW